MEIPTSSLDCKKRHKEPIMILKEYAMTKLEKLLPRKKELPITIRCSTGERIGQYEAGDADGHNNAIDDCLKALEGKVILLEDIDEEEIKLLPVSSEAIMKYLKGLSR